MVAIRRIGVPVWMYVLAILLGGCMAERSPQIPATAELSAEGNGKLAYRAPDDGKVFIFDRNDNRVIYSGDVARDQLVMVDPDTDRITVADRVVFEKGLHKGNSTRIFFEGGAEA